jgi:AcrR family transcriptional regulator
MGQVSESRTAQRSRALTDSRIREHARALLVEQGRAAVSLRAIARSLGSTAPALYRYYDSREHLIAQVCLDVCTDLAAELATECRAVPASKPTRRLTGVCRGFRRWALEHPREFELVFATPGCGSPARDARDPFGEVFLSVAGQVLIGAPLRSPGETAVPAGLRTDIDAFRYGLRSELAGQGFDVSGDVLDRGLGYAMVTFWVRLYGHVALEVFGRLPLPESAAEPLFESMLAELLTSVGLVEEGR